MQVINETGLTMVVDLAKTDLPDPTALILIKGTFRLVHGAAAVAVPEEKQRPAQSDTVYMDDLGRSLSWASDFAPVKLYTDCFVIGTAYAPGGVAVPTFQAGFRIGPLTKTIQVLGPRSRQANGGITPAEPVLRVPLRWELSQGGIANPDNPFGRGEDPIEDGSTPLPQIEGAGRPPSKTPTNLAPVPSFFPDRSQYAGTRDSRWALFRAPLPPLDFSPAFHNAAPFDQRAGNNPRGNESLSLLNLHPTIPDFATALPGVVPRVILVRIDGTVEDVAMAADTVVLLPDDDQLVMLWRATVPTTADLGDIAVVHGTLGRIGEPKVPMPEAATAAKAAHAAARKADPAAEIAAMEAEVSVEVRALLKDVDLPPPLRAIIETETRHDKLLAALAAHVDQALAKLNVVKV